MTPLACSRLRDIIQLLPFSEVNMRIYRPVKSDIDRGAAEVNITFYRSINPHIDRTWKAIIVLSLNLLFTQSYTSE